MSIKPRAVLVSVDYTDLLAITLPYNRHHFKEVTVITSRKDVGPVLDATKQFDAQVIATDLFYADGARFNKWRALEFGLDLIGRRDWICLMDADILWPRNASLDDLEIGTLYSPLRYMMEDISALVERGRDGIPAEDKWDRYPIHRNTGEWAGYSQIFHASDCHLPPPPWHQIDWIHAGGADSFFQKLWGPEDKKRLPWKCLHLGPAGQNWFGRATTLLDGKTPDGAEERLEKCRAIWSARRENVYKGDDRFLGERLDLDSNL